ncbi:hypothetical protein LguiB_028108 [Lonicera macranthoides]
MKLNKQRGKDASFTQLEITIVSSDDAILLLLSNQKFSESGSKLRQKITQRDLKVVGRL